MTFKQAIETLEKMSRNQKAEPKELFNLIEAYHIYGLLNAVRDEPRFIFALSFPCGAPAPFLRALLNNINFNPTRSYVDRLDTMTHQQLCDAVDDYDLFSWFWSARDEKSTTSLFSAYNTDPLYVKGTLTLPSSAFAQISRRIPEWKVAEVDEVLHWTKNNRQSLNASWVAIPVKYFNDDNDLWTEATRIEPSFPLLTDSEELQACYDGKFHILDAKWATCGGMYSELFNACCALGMFGYALYADM
jgi:hypothetical protein